MAAPAGVEQGSLAPVGETVAAGKLPCLPPPPSTRGGAPAVATFRCVGADGTPSLQLCWVGYDGALKPVVTIQADERGLRARWQHAEGTRVGHVFALRALHADRENSLGQDQEDRDRADVDGTIIGWFRPTVPLQGSRHAVTVEQLPDGGWSLTARASNDWQSGRTNPEYRVIVRPSSCGTDAATGERKPGAPLPPPADDWLLTYRYSAPRYPSNGWLPTEHTFFIW
jgi:hypothetical protein